MTDLTEQWKKGELTKDFYYVKCAWSDEIEIRYVQNPECGDVYEEIIAPVPNYEELQNMNEAVNQAIAANIKLVEDNKRLKHDVGNLGYKIKNQRHEIDNRLKEIAKLKELLKRARDLIEQISWCEAFYAYNDGLDEEIDEVLK